MTVHWNDKFPSERPNFGSDQVRSQSELVQGLVVLTQPEGDKFMIVGEPGVAGEEQGLWIKVRPWRFGRWAAATQIALADYNVVAYGDGRWHPTQWLKIGK